MNQLNFNTKKRNFKHLSEYERGEIYAMIKLGCSISSIARHLNRSRTTIYNELKRGSVEQIKNGRKVIVYYPDAGQAQYKRNRENSKKKFKALECMDFIRFVEASFKEKFGSIIYSVDGNKNAFKVVRLRGLMLLSALLFFIWKICQ